MRPLSNYDTTTRYLALIVLVAAVLAATMARSQTRERMLFERVVPPGATLTYAENGVVVRTMQVPPGPVRVTVEYGR